LGQNAQVAQVRYQKHMTAKLTAKPTMDSEKERTIQPLFEHKENISEQW